VSLFEGRDRYPRLNSECVKTPLVRGTACVEIVEMCETFRQ